ncbi:hypothetical protein J437_LFUL013835 [Ladona fulva]|uniref:Chitin-binding type-4 domain-containing protein n=1 Tax=Ladona fulva TaxID=123851 RepID=A0A8K0KHC8_LADFU|nr:hypothetical protein J437_LFUL013835 [Ladona fulva]
MSNRVVAKVHTMASKLIILAASVLVLAAVGVDGHGYLYEPCMRSSLWRLGAPVPVNWEDDQLNCGGFGPLIMEDYPYEFQTQWVTNGGKCGECGDAWNLARPRPNENGGKFGTGYIAQRYKEGELIDVHINITASHKGYFEFRLCPMDGSEDEFLVTVGKQGMQVDQECLDRHLLTLEDGSTQWILKTFEPGMYTMKVQLPKGIKCEACVFQWHWRTANSWGTCEDGHEAVGCGPQETWNNCADIAIE